MVLLIMLCALCRLSTYLRQVALLMLLCAWCQACPGAVAALLRTAGGAAWLVALALAADEDGDGVLQGLAAFLLAICVYYNDDSVENYSKVGGIRCGRRSHHTL